MWWGGERRKVLLEGARAGRLRPDKALGGVPAL